MWLLLTFLLALLRAVWAEPQPTKVDHFILPVTEGEPHLNISDSINPITGNFYLSRHDLVIEGAEPLYIPSFYVSGKGKAPYKAKSGWDLLPHLKLVLFTCEYDHTDRIILADKNGTRLTLDRTINNEYHIDLRKHGHGITNDAKGKLSARTNLRNTFVETNDHHRLTLHCADGTQRRYKYVKKDDDERYHEYRLYQLQWEQLPNGNRIDYVYDSKDRISYIKTTSPDSKKTYAWAQFNYAGHPHENPNFRIDTSDGKWITYEFEECSYKKNSSHGGRERNIVFLLKKINRNFGPPEHFHYDPGRGDAGPRISRIEYPGGFLLDQSYYYIGKNTLGSDYFEIPAKDSRINRVKSFSAPLDVNGKMIITHRFYYNMNRRRGNHYEQPCETQIFDIDNHQTTISATHYCRPYKISWYENVQGKQQLKRTENSFWGDHPSDIGNLQAKLFCDQTGQGVFAKIYSYDIFGNILSEKFCGNLSGAALAPVTIAPSVNAEPLKYHAYLIVEKGDYLFVSPNKHPLFKKKIHYRSLKRIGAGLYVPNDSLQTVLKLVEIKNDKIEFQILNKVPTSVTLTSSSEIAETTYGYTKNHLMAWKKEPSGRITRFTYHGSTDRIASRSTCEGDKVLLKESFIYDADLLLVKSIKEDLITKQQQIQVISYSNGRPVVIEDRTPSRLLRKTLISYTPQGKVSSEEVFDSHNQFQYRLSFTYDAKGRLIAETNPLGQSAQYEYDELGNKITSKDFSGRVITRYLYDPARRLIQTIEEGDDNTRRITSHKYNCKNQKISTIDFRGNETQYSYDLFGNLIGTTTHSSTYDSFGRESTRTDASGYTTQKTYNAYGKPTSISHPNGTQETLIYNLDGTLKTHIDAIGTRTEHQYDIFGRLLRKAIFSNDTLLSEERWDYSVLHLLSKTNSNGLTTTYEYDDAGYKVAENTASHRIEYTYDSLGRLHQTLCHGRVTELTYDLLDRIIEEKILDQQGTVLIYTSYAYDTAGNKTKITRWTQQGSSTEITLFDSFKRPIKHTDALGHTTTTTYTDFEKITTDPQGTCLIETLSLDGRLSSLELRSRLNELLKKESFAYDKAGNKTRQETVVMTPGVSPKTVITLWEYGPQNQLLALTEATGTPQERTTRYTYLPAGLIAQIHKPSGIILAYTYDPLHRLLELQSSDRTVHYRFTYTAGHLPTLIEDLIHNTVHHRTYDKHLALITEKLSNTLTLHSQYDPLGRKTALILPDGSSIAYQYDNLFLRQISRGSYTHQYTCFDLSGNLLEQSLMGDLGIQTFEHDALGRIVATASPFYQTSVAYDSRGNLISIGPNRYTYDDLAQLITEKDHVYSYDSNHNRIYKDGHSFQANALNQLSHFQYDSDGNLLSDGTCRYTYDALDRLMTITSPTHFAKFTYDSFHRRMTKELYTLTNGKHTLQSQLRFIYDGDNEIGAVDFSGKIVELRVLGLGKGAEIGAAVMIELDAQVFVPIHDLRGNIIHLISPKTCEAVESNSYSAFGEESSSNFRNPWRFCSKRSDTEFNLVYFGRRYYSPLLGRWLTPDPQGFTDGMNLYAFVHNNPLLKFDFYGLFSGSYNVQISVSLDTCLQIASGITQGLGHLLSAVGTHAIPSFMGGEVISQLGHLMAGLNYERSRSEILTFGNPKPGNTVCITGVNGIMNSRDEANNAAYKIFKTHGEVLVHFIYNSSHGFLSDLLEVFLDLVGIGSHPSRLLAQQWRTMIQQFKAENISGSITHYAHSQGGLITENALHLLTPEERTYIKKIVTFGSASLFSKELAANVVHYVAVRDIVPMTDIIGYFKAIFNHAFNRPTPVQFVGSFKGMPFVEHFIDSEPYASILKNSGQELKNEYFGR